MQGFAGISDCFQVLNLGEFNLHLETTEISKRGLCVLTIYTDTVPQFKTPEILNKTFANI